MEAAHEEPMGSYTTTSTCDSPSPVVLKRRRTIRHRAVAVASPASSVELSGMTEDEDDDLAANCLILLAQGRDLEAASEFYECKTCSKCFPSFQALGGHRASHKKPKQASQWQPSLPSSYLVHGGGSGGGKQRIHGCSVCGLEFPSGQALGGHMRRHRPAILPEVSGKKKEKKKKQKKNVLSLDLNLPAPSDDVDPFAMAGLPLSFSSAPPQPPPPPLVGCHY
ncbi:Zinc finger protein ZAT5 [Apostasia shenzhenica]|uniref:Zinc finger protein ZAT5 n=1 Tax=Apostasia shenzhenica TaxID=1088818 RepID=A0A2I0AB60_9ASPA|nr:Zinc finger protein ZAT5 [Apostasia shenzhenica]